MSEQTKPERKTASYYLDQYSNARKLLPHNEYVRLVELMETFAKQEKAWEQIEDARFFKSFVANKMSGYGTGTTQEERSAMEWIASEIFGKYTLLRLL